MENFSTQNKLIFFVVNIFIIFPMLIKYFSVVGLLVFISILAVYYYYLIIKNKDDLPASAYLTTFFFVDFLIYLSLNYKIIISGFSVEEIPLFFSVFFSNQMFIMLFLVGCAIGALGLKYSPITWLTGISASILGLVVIICYGTYYDGTTLMFYDVTKPFIFLYFIFVAIWTTFLIISISIDGSKRKNNTRMGVIMLVAFILLCITSIDIVSLVASEFFEIFFEPATKVLPWWKTLLVCLVLLGSATVIYNNKYDKKSRIDFFIVASIALFVFLVKLILINYMPYSILLIILLFISTIVRLYDEIHNKETLEFTSSKFLMVELVVSIVALFLLNIGCWLNLVISAVCVVVWKKVDWDAYKHKGYTWYGIITALFLETLALQWKLKFSVHNVWILVTIYIMGITTIYIINYSYNRRGNINTTKESSGYIYVKGIGEYFTSEDARLSVSAFICVFITLLCLASIRNTMKIKFDVDVNNKSVDISSSIKGKNNTIENISYIWIDYRGRTIYSEQNIDTKGGELTIMSDLLKVTAVDNKGFTSTYYKWFPYWLYSNN